MCAFLSSLDSPPPPQQQLAVIPLVSVFVLFLVSWLCSQVCFHFRVPSSCTRHCAVCFFISVLSFLPPLVPSTSQTYYIQSPSPPVVHTGKTNRFSHPPDRTPS
eukprot:Hpha_TRINITY_DN15428_c0_g1::TRINITY_DN15428_c0_g1_i2::g.174031::m.174031